MNTRSNPAHEPSAASPEIRPLYWSVRRELWENRSLYIAPLAVAGVLLLGFLTSLIHDGDKIAKIMPPVPALDPAQQAAAIGAQYAVAAMLVVLTGFIVGVFYCLDALHGERRDRSILFWKSLPVSDFTTVLSKATIPLVILPFTIFTIIVVLHLVMLLISIAILMAHDLNAATLWAQVPLFQNSLVLLHGLTALAVWHAPIYGWLLLVSAWARRTTFLWAVLPPLALCVVEWIAFRSSHFASMLGYRLTNSPAEVLAFKALGVDGHKVAVIIPLTELDPIKFLSTPALWIGLIVAAAFLAAAVWLRRYRDPL